MTKWVVCWENGRKRGRIVTEFDTKAEAQMALLEFVEKVNAETRCWVAPITVREAS